MCGTPASDHVSQPQTDELALLDDDDSMDPQDPEDEIQGMEIPAGFVFKKLNPLLLTDCFCGVERSLDWAWGGLEG
ncbi:unnamed protein product [Ectocarpus sp. CCAP 1310/34]|nr:unnamed protein product [Ectocarpus sp. CCAP 1310/34]